MSPDENRHWPFDVLPPERRTPLHQEQIRFLETAYAAGYAPYTFGADNYQATSANRGGTIFCRGSRGKHWEVLVGTAEETSLMVHVDDFRCAGEAVLQYLRGGNCREVFEHVLGHLFATPGCQFHVNNDSRSGEIICRNAWGTDWELSLSAASASSMSAHVKEFQHAAEALVQWLRGADPEQVIAFLQGRLRSTADCPQGFKLQRPEPIEEKTPA